MYVYIYIYMHACSLFFCLFAFCEHLSHLSGPLSLSLSLSFFSYISLSLCPSTFTSTSASLPLCMSITPSQCVCACCVYHMCLFLCCEFACCKPRFDTGCQPCTQNHAWLDEPVEASVPRLCHQEDGLPGFEYATLSRSCSAGESSLCL